MAQANAHPITPKASLPACISDARRKFADAIASFREIISPTYIAEPGKAGSTLLFPVSDDGWFPAFRCGEFAIIDTSDIQPAADKFFVRRISHNQMSIVRLRLHTDDYGRIVNPEEPIYVCDNMGNRYWEGVYWWATYGAQVAHNLRGDPVSFGGLDRFHMSDGPLGDKHMRPEIIGSVIGVLGRPGRALNWKGTDGSSMQRA